MTTARRAPAGAAGAAPDTLRASVPILLVDDNAGKRLALRAVLTPLGYAIVEADSGLAAMRCIMAQDFAVILLDVRMPVMDGFQTAAYIRKRRQSEMTPIIFVTSYGHGEVADPKLYAEGAVDFIFAPVNPDELRAKVSVFANLFIRARELATRAREVQASADQLRLLTDAAPIGIFQTDSENRYVYTNPRWSEITGVSAEAASGRDWDTTIGLSEAAGLPTDLLDPVLDRDEVCRRFEIRPPGLAPRIVLATANSIRADDGSVAGWVGTLADVTAETGAEVAMADARDRANEASQQKSDFLANMSHEIRTPMNGVLGMTDLLLETDLDVRQRDYAQTVRNSGEALITIINDILDFSKVEAGMLEVEDVEFEVRAIVQGVVDLLAGSAQAKGIELVAVTDNAVPAVVRGDPGRVRQVLTNLVGNAVKFTHRGEVVVRVTRLEADGEDAVVRVEVADTGDGIAAEKLELIFQPFAQADTSTSRRYGGTGLGLAISAQLIGLMGGEYGVSSELGVGSSFWFTVRVHADASQAVDAARTDPGLAGATALIVDGNPTLRCVLTEYLSEWGLVTETSDSGAAALVTLQAAAARGAPFDLALIDGSMPELDGLELKDAIVADPQVTTRPVLMTALGREEDLGDANGARPSISLSKPIHRDELRTCLRVALGLEAARVTLAGASASARSSDSPPDRGLLLLAEDNPINQKVAVAMLSGVGYRVDTVWNGAAAVEAVGARAYDAILMDCQMPELNGYQATAAIRAMEGDGRRTPIIAMTAGARRQDRERCLAEGMDDYLAKPMSKDALLALVARCLNGRLPVSAPPPSPAPPPEPTIDPVLFGELQALSQGADKSFLAELIDQFIDDTEPLLRQLGDALQVGDAIAAGRIAHGIKGSCVQLGGRRLASACDRLERNVAAGAVADGGADLHQVEVDYEDLRRTLKQRC